MEMSALVRSESSPYAPLSALASRVFAIDLPLLFISISLLVSGDRHISSRSTCFRTVSSFTDSNQSATFNIAASVSKRVLERNFFFLSLGKKLHILTPRPSSNRTASVTSGPRFISSLLSSFSSFSSSSFSSSSYPPNREACGSAFLLFAFLNAFAFSVLTLASLAFLLAARKNSPNALSNLA